MKMVWVVAIAVPVAGIDAIAIAVTRRGQKAVTATHNDIFDIFGRISMLLRIWVTKGYGGTKGGAFCLNLQVVRRPPYILYGGATCHLILR
eukprot:COSAG05_NODE_1414_length_4943_cov_9.634806_1_plen_91_part_00